MKTRINLNRQRTARTRRIRAGIRGDLPRLSVFRSLRYINAQIIDDQKGQTIASAAGKENEAKTNKTKMATIVGQLIAKRALEKNITKVVFDRGRYRYHGRVKALAEAARAAGLKF